MEPLIHDTREQNSPVYKEIRVCDPTSIGRGKEIPGCDGLRGYGTHRLKRDDKYHADEVRLSDEFAKMNGEYPNLLEQIVFGNDTHCVMLDDHEKRLAATIIQWLGTPVGKGFMRNCGFTCQEDAEHDAQVQRRQLYEQISKLGEFDSAKLKEMLGIK